jgi:pSer/pThr/pTyr-binding forkhead associated (FHA) protein
LKRPKPAHCGYAQRRAFQESEILMSRLIVMSKTTTVKQVNLRDGVASSIGRDEHCDVVISAPQASRRHAEIRVDGDTAMVRDLGSSNGTFVNGRRIQQHELRHGDILAVGGCEIRYLASVRVSQPSELLELVG